MVSCPQCAKRREQDSRGGKIGGLSRSPRKREAAARNARLGGRARAAAWRRKLEQYAPKTQEPTPTA